mmetsp:Transcript_734/g.2447  ORF Transcript_734/g.2447 Transcript_734/m.2447 type:complete len:104 (-) Transcript_734:1296-1607(-)
MPWVGIERMRGVIHLDEKLDHETPNNMPRASTPTLIYLIGVEECCICEFLNQKIVEQSSTTSSRACNIEQQMQQAVCKSVRALLRKSEQAVTELFAQELNVLV